LKRDHEEAIYIVTLRPGANSAGRGCQISRVVEDWRVGQKQLIEFLYAGQGIGRPFVAPPDLPADRVRMLRDAFNTTMKDPAFVADVAKQKLDLEPEDGEHLGALIKKIYATPKAVVDKISELVK